MESALRWIATILRDLDVPFLISGGLAARLYGGTRPLADIDIDIPEDRFDDVWSLVAPYVIFGPARYRDNCWDLMLMTLCYDGQDIDLCGAESTRVFCRQTNEWVDLPTNFENLTLLQIGDVQVPVMNLSDLIEYKSRLLRDVDKLDLNQLASLRG